MKRSVLFIAAAFACSAALAAPTVAEHGSLHAPPVDRAGVLYSQDGKDSGIGIVSQYFGDSFEEYDSRAADDFIVQGRWAVTEVDAPGRYFNGSGLAESENVTFFENKHGLPGRVIKDIESVSGRDDGKGNLKIRITKTQLRSGTAWVSVQVVMNFLKGGEWGWENQTTAVNHPAVWENPGGGFGTHCSDWGPESECMPEGEADHMFTLKGRAH